MKRGCHPKRRLLLEQWPEADRRAWLAATDPELDLLDPVKPAAKWRPSTRELFGRIYGLWLSWLVSEGHLEDSEAPADRVTPERLTRYLRQLRAEGCGAKTLVNHATALHYALQAMAPDRDWKWLWQPVRKLKPSAVRIRSHTELPSIRELFDLGWHLMKRAHQGHGLTPKMQSIALRNGLAIAMLAARPVMRRTNLARIEIGKNLIDEGPVFRLEFSAAEMKGGHGREATLPEVLTEPIRAYLEVYRPRLLAVSDQPSDRLFISGMGLPIYPKALSHEIGRVTQAAFGKRITAHDFRHAAGTSIANETPAQVGITRSVLGHTDLKTSKRYYIWADQASAFEAMDEALTRIASSED